MNNFYAFSGLDGAGKSTQIDYLKEHFVNQKKSVKVIWSRGGYTPIFEMVKKIVRKFNSKNVPKSGKSSSRTKSFGNPLIRKTWLTIALFDLMLLYGIYFRWKRITGTIVIADRYIEDTAIDFKQNFPQEKVKEWLLWKLIVEFIPKPSKHFVLTIPVETSMKRSIEKNEPFPDDEAILAFRLNEYYTYCQNSDRFLKIDGTNDRYSISNYIKDNL